MAIITLNNNSISSITSLPAAISTGKVLQVAQGKHTTQASMSSTTFVDVSTNTNVNFTCSSTSNKVLILAHFHECYFSGTHSINLRVTAGGTAIMRTNNAVYVPNVSGEKLWNQDMTFLYSPSSTSQIEYKLQFASQNTTQVRVNQNGTEGGSTLTLMEIEG